MVTDIRLQTSITTNTKIKRLVRRKGADGFVNLVNLWVHTATHNSSGFLVDMDKEDIMDAAQTSDERYVDLLIELNLLDEVFEGGKTTLKIHNWEKYQGWVVGSEKRSELARKAAKSRWDASPKKGAKK